VRVVNLSFIFTNVAHKTLVAVDLPNMRSNQHELNGVQALKEFFGTGERTRGTISWYYFADDQEPIHEETEFTFYDARENHPTRTEWRLYYQGSFLAHADVGDRLFIVRSTSGQIFGLVFQIGSAWLRAAQTLFGSGVSTAQLDLVPRETLENQELELLRRQILDELNLDIAIPVTLTDEELMIEKYGRVFPSTKEMALFARSQVEVDPSNADETLVRWLNREEELFRALERVVIGERLKEGFNSVDDFIEYSLSVQNRRKSRMGFALQNHLAELFTVHDLRFTPQARTEANNRPDFIFPGQDEYHDQAFDAALLLMLGVKSTSKDRWRQVLTEADRIPAKHLCTLEAGVSVKQTNEMKRQNLTLVIPSSLHETYTGDQREVLLNVGTFIELAREKQTLD
jgi:restriction endonuclease EcoRII-like protein